MEKQTDTLAILKLYELRRDPDMRTARQWYFSDFAPQSAMDIIALFSGGERASANYRMVTSYWDMAASIVLNGGIDKKLFLDANTEHVFIYAKVARFLEEVRDLFRDPGYLVHLEQLVKGLPDFDAKMASRTRLIALWQRPAD
ncbi:MAG: hypothetical protein ABR535_06390 [Pyrinomonadaceae bacterium]